MCNNENHDDGDMQEKPIPVIQQQDGEFAEKIGEQLVELAQAAEATGVMVLFFDVSVIDEEAGVGAVYMSGRTCAAKVPEVLQFLHSLYPAIDFAIAAAAGVGGEPGVTFTNPDEDTDPPLH